MKRIHVNAWLIKYNAKHGTNFPPCRVEDGPKTRYGSEVQILGPSKMVYSPKRPLACGAKLWIETDAEVKILDEVDYKKIRKQMEALRP